MGDFRPQGYSPQVKIPGAAMEPGSGIAFGLALHLLSAWILDTQ